MLDEEELKSRLTETQYRAMRFDTTDPARAGPDRNAEIATRSL